MSKSDSYNVVGKSILAIGDIFGYKGDLHTHRGKPVEDVVKNPLEGNMEKYLQVGSSLQEP